MEILKVRLTPYPVTAIPEGWEPTAKKSTSKRDPLPQPYNWFGRTESVQHDVFAMLAETETGLAVEDIKAKVTNSEKVEDVVKFLAAGNCRFTGWDLVTKDGRYRLLYRDPRVSWKEVQGLTGDFSGLADMVPDYVKKVQKSLEAATKPQVEKKARVRQPKAPGAASAAPSASAEAAPGNQLAAIEAKGKTAELNEAIVAFCEPQVHDQVRAFVDQWGLEGGKVIEQVAEWQRQNVIKSGFYKKLKDLALALQS